MTDRSSYIEDFGRTIFEQADLYSPITPSDRPWYYIFFSISLILSLYLLKLSFENSRFSLKSASILILAFFLAFCLFTTFISNFGPKRSIPERRVVERIASVMEYNFYRLIEMSWWLVLISTCGLLICGFGFGFLLFPFILESIWLYSIYIFFILLYYYIKEKFPLQLAVTISFLRKIHDYIFIIAVMIGTGMKIPLISWYWACKQTRLLGVAKK